MITQLLKKEEKYLSWEEYKKKIIELEIVGLIERFIKQNSGCSYADIGTISLARLERGKNEGNLLK